MKLVKCTHCYRFNGSGLVECGTYIKLMNCEYMFHQPGPLDK